MSNMQKKPRKKIKGAVYFDYSLLAVLVFLVCFGLVMLYSSSAYGALVKYNDSMHYFKRQIFFCVLGFAGMYVVSKIDYHEYIKWGRKIFYCSIVLMALVQTPLGVEVNGARRWIQLPFGQQFQPAEVTKIAVIVFIPVVICQLGKEIKTLKGMGQAFLWGLLAAGCVYILTENLSTAIIVMGITCVMIFVVHPKTRPFVILACAGLALILIGVQILGAMLSTSESFRLRRILVWLNPEQYSSAGGYQIMQALYAIGSGGFFGKGLGNSVQKLGPVPEAQNDMIFAIVCEELGVFGGLVVLILFGYLLYRLFFIAENAPDFYGSLVVGGIMIHIALQVILNICVVLNWIPTTGITLPFISYGGTSILFLMLEMGIALSVSRQIKFAE